MARTSSFVAGALAIAACAAGVAACGVIAGLPSEYELAPDGAVDFGQDGSSAGDTGSTDGSVALDSGGTTDDAAGDASSQIDTGVDAGTRVPPSDPALVTCGAVKCNLFQRICCTEQSQAPQCQDRSSGCNGAKTQCDEAADCINNDRCCVTDVDQNALATQCQQSCTGQPAQSCRSNAECANGETCIAWTCAGHVVATCNGRGQDGGCVP